tara:strand:- start:1931 stop:3139 length:1209 start_codon:yes stop_codon:yes gene_type:complete
MKICIIGGGTTGWMAAAHIEKHLPESTITLIESPTIPIMGVGESSLPQLRNFFLDLGLKDEDWIDECNAIIKIGNEKINWTGKNNLDNLSFQFWHNDNNVFDNWVKDYFNNKKQKSDLNQDLYDNTGWRSIAYHLEADKISSVLKKYCKKVHHEEETITNLPDGYDLYLDCTGFSRQFVVDKTFNKFDNQHIINRAWVCSYELEGEPYPHTRSIATDDGWMFSIHTQNKDGRGYCFSTRYCSEEEALKNFTKLNQNFNTYKNSKPRLLKWESGFLENPWTDSTVCLGLAGGFIEPLESNSLFMIQFSITNLVNCLKRGYNNKTYNRMMKKLWLENSNFLLHIYKLSPRKDTPFWNHYDVEDTDQTLWKNYKLRSNKWSYLYPSSLWATLGLLYDEFKYYTKP